MGLREIVGVTVSIVLLVYMLWFIVPELKTTYNGVTAGVNQTSPTMLVLLPVSNGWFTILPLFAVLIGGYSIWLYASRRNAEDY